MLFNVNEIMAWRKFDFITQTQPHLFPTGLTTKSEVALVEADLSGVLLDEGVVRLSHVVELECKKSLSVVGGRLRRFGGVLGTDHAVFQLVVSTHRVLRLAVVVLGGQLLVLAGLIVLLVCLHLTWGKGFRFHSCETK